MSPYRVTASLVRQKEAIVSYLACWVLPPKGEGRITVQCASTCWGYRPIQDGSHFIIVKHIQGVAQPSYAVDEHTDEMDKFPGETPSLGLSKNSNLQYVYHCIFIYFVECWLKTHYLLYCYCSFVDVGIVRIDGLPYKSQPSKNKHHHHSGVTQRHDNGEVAHPTPRSLCGKG
jgi:hypothetical protein